MGLFKTKITIKGGGPCDGAERILQNSQNLVLVARMYVARDKLGVQSVVQDSFCAHAYVRLDAKTFVYDGLRFVESDSPVPVEERSFT